MTVSRAPFKTDIPQRTIIPFGMTECTIPSAQQPARKPKLLDQLREAMKSRHYSHRTKAIHEKDIKAGWGSVLMSDALDRKYPNAPKEWRWQWVFPQGK